MQKFKPSLAPLVLALLFGLTISLVPATPAFSNSAPACVGSGTPSSSLKLGGRIITPSLILRAGGTGQPCLAGETALSLVSLSRIIIVSPVATATMNGTALLAAMTFISTSNPSNTNPWLLKLEPGLYDLGNQSLTMLPYVDLEGSGEDTTIISSTVGSGALYPASTGTLVAASHSEARFLSVASVGTFNTQVAVFVPTSATAARFFRLTLTASGGPNNLGLYNAGGTVTVENSTLTVTGSTDAYGLLNNGGTATVLNNTLIASGGSDAWGVNNNTGTVTVQNSSLKATAGTTGIGLYNEVGGTALVERSTLSGSGGAFGYGLANNAASTAAVAGSSQLAGSSLTSVGLTKCPGSYSGGFIAFIPPNC